MYREDYSVVIPKFNEVKVSIDELGAVSGKLDVKTDMIMPLLLIMR